MGTREEQNKKKAVCYVRVSFLTPFVVPTVYVSNLYAIRSHIMRLYSRDRVRLSRLVPERRAVDFRSSHGISVCVCVFLPAIVVEADTKARPVYVSFAVRRACSGATFAIVSELAPFPKRN